MERFYRAYIAIVGLLGVFVSLLIYAGVKDANFRLAQHRFHSLMSQYQTALQYEVKQSLNASGGTAYAHRATRLDLAAAFQTALTPETLSLIHIQLVDRSSPQSPKLLQSIEPDARYTLVSDLRYTGSFQPYAGASWELKAEPSTTYIRQYYLANAVGILVTGFLFTGAVLVFLLLVAKRTREVQRLVEQKGNELKAVNRKLELLSLTDPLTGLVNRRGFDQTLDLEWNRAIRDRNPVTLLFIDVDFFKLYNDCYGHIAGDNCLTAVGEALGNVPFRLGDVVARYGGEEFALILPNTDDQRGTVAERCRRSVECLQIRHETSEIAKVVTASVGAATMLPHLGGEPLELVRAADEALYRAKSDGRNRVRRAEMNESMASMH